MTEKAKIIRFQLTICIYRMLVKLSTADGTSSKIVMDVDVLPSALPRRTASRMTRGCP